MTHPLKTTRATINLLRSILMLPETFTTIPDVLIAGKVLELLELPWLKGEPTEAEKQAWIAEPFEGELTEKQRDLCKQAVTKHASKLPIGPTSLALFEQLGLGE